MIVELLLFVALVALLLIYSRPPPGLPPGLWGLPFIGTFPDTSKISFVDYVHKLAKQYGDLFYLKMGSRMMFFISDFAMAKDAYSGPDALDHPHMFTRHLISNFKHIGIFRSTGDRWQSNRRSSLRYLRDFGMGKSSLQETIQDETMALLKDLDQCVGKASELSWNLNVAILNVIWKIVADQRYEVTDKRIHNFSYLMNANRAIMAGPVAFLDIFPAIIPLVPAIIKNKWMKVDVMAKNNDQFLSYIREEIEAHRKSLDPDNPRDYIDSFLMEIKDKENYKEELNNLTYMIGDLFIAGSETTATSLRWFVLYMALNPDIQKKVQDEIDNVVGEDKLPGLEDRNSLMYLEAVIHEVHRKASLVVFSLPHQASKDMKLGGYTVPKDSIILLLLNEIHNDKKYWEKPDMFYPEHFLDENRKVVTKKDGFLPFSIGRRQCLGESLARMEMFLFSAAILQRYSISAPPGEKLTDEPDTTSLPIRLPKAFKIVITKRH